MKKITIIVPYDIWEAARKKMVTDGNSLQGLLSRALTEYVERGEDDASTTNKPKKNS